jgi:large subunit ribosomal protein L23
MEILKKPILTEKMAALGEKLNRYAFMVDTRANKIDIKKAIEGMYNVNIDAVNTMVVRGKRKTRGTKSGFVTGKTTRYKKAIITLQQGQTIDFYESI